MKDNSSVLFSLNNIYFGHKEPIKTNFLDFGVLGSKFVKFLMSVPHVNVKVIHFLLWAKGSHQSSNLNTFECSGENLPNSSCHFPSSKSVFLQVLHHSSVS